MHYVIFVISASYPNNPFLYVMTDRSITIHKF